MNLRCLSLLLLLAPPMAAAQESSSLAPRVQLDTSLGTIVIELDAVRAPLSAENFLRYVRDGHFDGTVFHRVIPNFVIQGGGFDGQLAPRAGRAPIPNESGNGLSNRRGTLGLAREDSPHSGSAQFYINLNDNAGLDPLPSRWGFAVFGRVVEGMEVVDRIAYLQTRTITDFAADVPVDPPVVRRAFVVGEPPPAPPPAAEPPAAPAVDPAP
jgi:cyclophilin family peptidyl-prolyl cis-trans isomerase